MESLNDAQSAEGAPFSASPFSSDAHPSRKRHWKEIESSDNNDVVNIHSNTAREAKIQARSHIFPTETQKIALFELKDLPDQAIFTWLAMARSGSVGMYSQVRWFASRRTYSHNSRTHQWPHSSKDLQLSAPWLAPYNESDVGWCTVRHQPRIAGRSRHESARS